MKIILKCSLTLLIVISSSAMAQIKFEIVSDLGGNLDDGGSLCRDMELEPNKAGCIWISIYSDLDPHESDSSKHVFIRDIDKCMETLIDKLKTISMVSIGFHISEGLFINVADGYVEDQSMDDKNGIKLNLDRFAERYGEQLESVLTGQKLTIYLSQYGW